MLKQPPPPDYCRLCVRNCNDNQHSLYDERGQANANHDLVGKYFTNAMLNMAWETRLQYICGKCWQHIWEFHQFQESIIEEQKGLHLNEEVANQVEEVAKVKSEMYTKEEPLELQGLSASTQESVKPADLTFDIKSEEPLDLNNDHEVMLPQDGQDHLTDEEMSLVMSSSKENASLQNNVESNEDYSSSDDMPLSSLDKTNLCFSDKKVHATKKSIVEFDELVASWRSSLECEICHQLVASYSQLKEHFSKNHASEGFYLMCCQLRLETRYDIERHIHYHNAPQQLKCETCCKVYSSEQNLRVHRKCAHTSKGKDKNAKDIQELQGKYCCVKCSKIFATEQHLKKHNRNVHKPKILECKFCEKSFMRPNALRDHLAGHKGEKSYVCSVCPKAFIVSSSFSTHMKKNHPQEWKKMQNDSDQVEARRGYRQESRGDSVTYVCIYCSKEGNKRINMYYHAKRCQRYKKGFRLESRGKFKVHVCIYCGLEYEKRHSMYHHLNHCHGDDGSLVEQQTSLISEPLVSAEKVDIEPVLNKHQLEAQQEWHGVKGLGASTEGSIKSTDLTFEVKTEEPLDLNSYHERLSSQDGQDYLTDEALSPMMSNGKEKLSLENDVESNEDYSSSDGLLLSSLGQTKVSSSKSKFAATKRSVEEFDELVALWRSTLECDICHQLVASYSQLKEHFSKNHVFEGCYLMCCQLRLETRYDIDRHIHYHNAPQQLKCEACCKAYNCERTLRRHKINVHTSKGGDKHAEDSEKLEAKYRCVKCSKEFSSKNHLDRHHQNAHKPKILECNFCEQTFVHPGELRKHLAGHKGENTYGCSLCPKQFSWRSSLYKHVKKDHPQEWKKMQNDPAQTETRRGYRQETRGDSVTYVCIYCPKEGNKRINMYYHAKRCQRYGGSTIEPKTGWKE
uniref:Uncharacterized protein n=1 Tax=Stomoxys calcitrans TaxID=35570 RepID=A0A1I8NYC5_STOCA